MEQVERSSALVPTSELMRQRQSVRSARERLGMGVRVTARRVESDDAPSQDEIRREAVFASVLGSVSVETGIDKQDITNPGRRKQPLRARDLYWLRLIGTGNITKADIGRRFGLKRQTIYEGVARAQLAQVHAERAADRALAGISVAQDVAGVYVSGITSPVEIARETGAGPTYVRQVISELKSGRSDIRPIVSRPAWKIIVDSECAASGIDRRRVMGRERCHEVNVVRQSIWLRMREELGMLTTEIGRHFGRDHSTICNGIDKARRRRATRLGNDKD